MSLYFISVSAASSHCVLTKHQHKRLYEPAFTGHSHEEKHISKARCKNTERVSRRSHILLTILQPPEYERDPSSKSAAKGPRCVSGTDRTRRRASVLLFTTNIHISITHTAPENQLTTCNCTAHTLKSAALSHPLHSPASPECLAFTFMLVWVSFLSVHASRNPLCQTFLSWCREQTWMTSRYYFQCAGSFLGH